MRVRSSRTRTRTARGRFSRSRCEHQNTSRGNASRGHFRLQIANCRLQITNFKLRVASCELRVGTMNPISRRAALRIVSSAPMAAVLAWTPAEARQAHEHAEAARQQDTKQAAPFRPRFFTAHEYATVAILVDLIIPRDERSG